MSGGILVITTGGTIGIDGGLIKDVSRFDIISPFKLLSENMQADYYNPLVSLIAGNIGKGYKGIIITHGSDTLHYTSNMLGILFGSAGIPIMLVASDKPLSDPEANGRHNFDKSVEFIEEGRAKTGVFVIYRNPNGQTNLHIGTRLLQCAHFTDELRSAGSFPEGALRATAAKSLMINGNSIKNDVLMLKMHPALDFDGLRISDNIRAVLCQTYHSSTAPTAVAGFAQRMKKQGTEVWLAPFSGAYYESSKDIMSSGTVKTAGAVTVYAAFAKLLLRPLFDEDIMDKEIYYEYVR